MQDDAHIFCLEDQIKDEIRGVLDLTEEILQQFGFDKYEVNLSTRPEKAVGDDEIWERATSSLKDALEDKGWSYQIDDGGGAFYGPKIDLKIEDALGRKWQCSTIQACFDLGLLSDWPVCSMGPLLSVLVPLVSVCKTLIKFALVLTSRKLESVFPTLFFFQAH